MTFARRLAAALAAAVALAAAALPLAAQTPAEQMAAFYAAHPACAAPPPADPTAPAEPALRDELLAMVAADQADRAFLQTLGAAAPPDSLVQRMARADTLRTGRLREIVAAGGWPTADRVGRDGVQAAFLVLQHSPDAVLQAILLPDVEAAYARGDVSGDAVALLTDRARVHAGLPQRYGSQARIEDGAVVFAPTQAGDVDARRAALCMVPQAVYRAVLEEAYGLRDHGLLPDEPQP